MKKMRVNLDVTINRMDVDEGADLYEILRKAVQRMRAVGYEDSKGHGADILDVELNELKVEDSR